MKDNGKTKKVLQVNASLRGYGGVSAIIFNIYKNIDRSKVQFDFLSPNKTTYEPHRKEIEEMGGNLYGLNINKNKIINKILLAKRLNEFLKKHKYDIIHINSGSYFFNLQVAVIAKKNKIERIIVHSHNTLNGKNKIKNWLVKLAKPILNLYATDFLSCSQKAAKDMFTKKVLKEKTVILKNGINVEKFKFKEEIRKKVRKELNIEEEFVIGNVGRFTKQKNQEFLIECFNEIHKIDHNTILILVGEGELENKLKQKATDLQLMKNIRFLGFREDVNEIMQAFDVFLLPSLFEGLPIVGVEAQAAGLRCIMSDTITKEVDQSNHVKFLNLEKDSLQDWANEILRNREYARQEIYNKILQSGYDIKDTAKTLLSIYLK